MVLSLSFLQRLAVFPPKEYRVHVLIASNVDLCRGFLWYLGFIEKAIVLFFVLNMLARTNSYSKLRSDQENILTVGANYKILNIIIRVMYEL